jgi:integrase/recombinase XerD
MSQALVVCAERVCRRRHGAWLGHVSLDTTHIYAEVDMEMTAKALASVDVSALPEAARRGGGTPSLMSFLKAL